MVSVGLDRPLSILELTALGILSKKGPCVAHAVLLEFSGSQTLAYRTGAGSIYPLLKRLHQTGYLSLEGKKYAITALGLSVLRQWLASDEVSTNLDPLRSRLYFIGLLPIEDQLSFVDRNLASLEGLLVRARQDVDSYKAANSHISALAMQGAVLETEARIQWLKSVKESLVSSTKGEAK